MKGNLKQNSVLCCTDLGSSVLGKTHTEVSTIVLTCKNFHFFCDFFSKDEIFRDDI